jgi:hypothetical protein
MVMKKMQSGGRRLFEMDMNKCTCHQIQLAWGEARKIGQAGKDIATLEKFVIFVIDNASILSSLKIYQCVNELESLNLVVGNETRWEGDYRFIERESSFIDELNYSNERYA